MAPDERAASAAGAVGWRRRATPLAPAAALGQGAVGAALCRAVAERLGDGVELEVHAGDRHVLVIGPAEQLPWVDGATWLGWEAGVLVPTTLEPTPDPTLVARAARKASPTAGWIALTPGLCLVGDRSIVPPEPGGLRRIAEALAAG